MARHRKTLKLSRTLKISRREAIGLLIDLWTWGMDNADKDGLLTGLEAEDIAEAMDYPRKRGVAIVDAIVDAGYIDRTDSGYVLHDWYTYCGKLNDKREDTKRRVEAYRSNRKKPVTSALRNADVTRTVTQDVTPCNASTVPNRTVPNIYINQSINTESMDGQIDTVFGMTQEEATRIRDDQEAIFSEAQRCGLPVTQQGMDTAMALYTEHGKDKLLEAIRKTGDQPKDKWHWRYAKAILTSKPKEDDGVW
jgi:hypothetical protein